MRSTPWLLLGPLAWVLACTGTTCAGTPFGPEEPPAADTASSPVLVTTEADTDTDDKAEVEAAKTPPAKRKKKRKRKPGNPGPKPTAPTAPAAPAAPPAGEDAVDDDDSDSDAPPPAGGGAAPKPTASAPGPKPPGITKVGARSWTVTKTLFDKWKDDPYKLGRIKDAGAGWEVRQVRQKHGYHLGIRGKDVVLTVNGRKLDTDAQLLGAYVALKFKKKFDVEVVRGGKTRVHHYEVVND
jgi:hypothetical protein